MSIVRVQMKIAKTLTVVLALIGLGYLVLMASIWFGPACEISTLRTVISPNKKYEANLVVQKCPDKNEPTLELQIIDKDIPNQIHSSVIAVATSTDIDLTWLSEKKLQVLYPSSLRITQEPSELNSIQLAFTTKNSNPSVKRDALDARPLP